MTNDFYSLGKCAFCRLECPKGEYYHSECSLKAWDENALKRAIKKQQKKERKERENAIIKNGI